MNDGEFFADAELPFHVWVRERSGDGGCRWVLREAPPREPGALSDPGSSKPGAGSSSG